MYEIRTQKKKRKKKKRKKIIEKGFDNKKTKNFKQRDTVTNLFRQILVPNNNKNKKRTL